MGVVDLAEEVVGGVLQHAELLRGAAVAADAGAVEALRWSGALPLLLRDLGVPRLLSTAAVWRAVDEGPQAVVALLQPVGVWGLDQAIGADEETAFVDHVVLLLSGFLWENEPKLQQLLGMGVVRRLVVCSSLSERAHECFDFGELRQPQKMAFDGFAAVLAAHNAFRPRASSPERQSVHASHDDNEDEWGWDEDNADANEQVPTGFTDEAKSAPRLLEGEVVVVHMPLNHAPLLHAKGQHTGGEPSLFVLSHPICATAFPLLLTRVLRHHQRKLDHIRASHHIGPSPPLQPLPVYSHVKEVSSEHLPGEFRRTLKLVAYALGEILVQARLDAKERIYTLGNTSLKIGHTLLKIVNDLQEDLTTHALQAHQQATIILVDRTCDLASPCSFGVSLLDRVLALLPQSPHDEAASDFSQSNRKGLHITEIFPLHGCEPSPLSVTLPLAPDQVEHFLPSSFVGAVKWRGGASLCHPRASQGLSVFRSLAFRPAKLALRDLDKRLQEVEKELVLQKKISRSGSRKPGEKPPSTRGRDVVLRRMSNILEAGEPTSLEHSALIELGIIVLETLERMESVQSKWDVCRERAARHIQLRKQGAGEWIIPELADTVQRQFVAFKSSGGRSFDASPSPVSFDELLTLLIHAYALSSGSPVEDYTIQLIRNVVAECVLETALKDPSVIEKVCPELMADLLPFTTSQEARQGGTASQPNNDQSKGEGEDEEWGDWEDPHSPRAFHAQDSKSDDDEYERVQAKVVVDGHMERLLSPLKECAQLFAKQHEAEYRIAAAAAEAGNEASPRCLLAQLCSSVLESDHLLAPRGSFAELEHIVDASEQLTRAGIDLLKSGFSRFGFGGASGASTGQSGGGGIMGESKILVVFVVGGVTFEEVQEVNTALEGKTDCQVIVGGTTITNSDILIEQLFR